MPAVSAADLYRVDASGQYVHPDLLQAEQDGAAASEECVLRPLRLLPRSHHGPHASMCIHAQLTPSACRQPGPSQDLFTAAVEAEQHKAHQRGRHLAAASVTFKEVSAAALKELAPQQKAEIEQMREALGAEYVASLSAGIRVEPTKLAKRKHQIYSLYHHAKTNELSDLEKKGQGMTNKAATKSKYGW